MKEQLERDDATSEHRAQRDQLEAEQRAELTPPDPVRHVIGPRGNANVNHFTVGDGAGGEWFQSYRSIVGHRSASGLVTLDRWRWEYSPTTSKCRGYWLGESTAVTRRKISEGTYQLEDLNEGRSA